MISDDDDCRLQQQKQHLTIIIITFILMVIITSLAHGLKMQMHLLMLPKELHCDIKNHQCSLPLQYTVYIQYNDVTLMSMTSHKPCSQHHVILTLFTKSTGSFITHKDGIPKSKN